MSENNLVIAKKDRAIIRSSVDKYIKQIQDALETTDADLLELEIIVEQLNEASTELKKIDLEIKKLLKDNQLDSELQSAEEYREKIITWRFKAKRKLKENKKPENPIDSPKENYESKKETIQIKLPKLEIIKFSGNSSDWLTFWSTFENAIHENNNLDPVDKFNYLKSYLTGDALKSIEGFAITSDNYFKCIDLITQRFGKKEILIDAHMNNLLNIYPVKSSNDVKALRKLYDKLQVQIRSLETLNVNLSTYGNLLCPIILKLLPKELMLEFHKENINNSFTVEDLLNFLFIQINARERTQMRSETGNDCLPRQQGARFFSKTESASPPICSPPIISNVTTGQTRHLSASNLFNKTNRTEKVNKHNCSFCEKGHDSNTCFQTMNLPFEKKLEILKRKGICYRCLKIANHIGRYCDSNIICSYCNGKHADIMCNRKKEKKEVSEIESSNGANQTLTNGNKSSNVYLQTLIAEIRGNKSSALIRILIDTGSENTYISSFIANKLNLKKIKTEKIKHGLFGGIELTEEHSRYKFNLTSLDKTFNFEMEALNQNKICSGVKHVTDRGLIKSLERENVFLSDVYEKGNLCLFEDNPEEVHLLVGVDMAAHLFTPNIKYFPNFGLTAFQTKLGWVVMGRNQEGNVNNRSKNDTISSLSLSLHVSNCKLAELWRLDTLGISNEENRTKADLEEETQKHFLKTVKRDISGRFEVSLPWIVEPSLLPSNRSIAENAAYKTEKKLSAAKNKEEYSEIFDFWKSNEIIEEVSDEKKDKVHFLPHRPVIKETSATTKIRPVFNASAHTKNSPSLNDCLTKGPNLIEIIPRILNRFRKYRIGISSDIEKAFLQIKIIETDRDFLRFFWFDKENNLKVYRHCCVVFGLTSSPFLLVATLKYLLSEVEPPLTETAKILERSFYIDNSLTSLDSEQETKKFMKESVSILASGHFNLRCWTSNSPAVLNGELENGSKIASVLGLDWDTETDNLMCKLDKNFKIEEPYTKRKILSVVQKIFDPIGFTAPVILIPKLVLQQTWIKKLKWDEVLPENLKKQFNKWVKDIDLLPEIKIPRWLNIESINENRATLHVFSDASKNAYAACAFIRVETPEGIKIQLVNARSRVTPIKELTIPRLELLSCLIGARLAKTISLDLEIDIPTTFWSDSTTALGWIRREQTWGTYVHNRVLEIRTLSNVSDWKHVPGTLNPADLPSRGCSFEQLKFSKWWEGHSWLYLSEDKWPQIEDPPDEEQINKKKRKHDKEHKSRKRHHRHHHSHNYKNSHDANSSKGIMEDKSFHDRHNNELKKNPDQNPIDVNSRNLMKDVTECDRQASADYQERTEVRHNKHTKHSYRNGKKNNYFLEEMKVEWRKKRLIWLQHHKKRYKEQKAGKEKYRKSKRREFSEQLKRRDVGYAQSEENSSSCSPKKDKKKSEKEHKEKKRKAKKSTESSEGPDSDVEITKKKKKKHKNHNNIISLGSSEEENMDYEENKESKPLTDGRYDHMINQDNLDTEGLHHRARYRQENAMQQNLTMLKEELSKKDQGLRSMTGKDGIARLAQVQTQNGIFLRPLQRLFPLEVNSSAISSSSSSNLDPVDPIPPMVITSSRETKNQPVDTTPPVVTRSGRVVKNPDRFHS